MNVLTNKKYMPADDVHTEIFSYREGGYGVNSLYHCRPVTENLFCVKREICSGPDHNNGDSF